MTKPLPAPCSMEAEIVADVDLCLKSVMNSTLFENHQHILGYSIRKSSFEKVT